MYRQTHCADCPTKRIAIKAYFAYRLPGSNAVNWLSGTYRPIVSLIEVTADGIVVSDFAFRKKVMIENLMESCAEEFVFNLSEGIPSTTKREEYQKSFAHLKDEMAMGKIRKVVLSRIVSCPCKKHPVEIFQAMNSRYHNSFNYLLHLPETGTWLGASPELLADFSDAKISTCALAGTLSSEAEISWTEKEYEEHDIVTGYIRDVLQEGRCWNIDIAERTTVNAGPVKHLRTEITAELFEKTSWKDILAKLHPTPAVCGIPLREAMKFIRFNENHDRKLYTGFIGIVGAKRQTFFVNLRCMEMYLGLANLYVGGGITRKSDPDHEWAETERKAETLKMLLD